MKRTINKLFWGLALVLASVMGSCKDDVPALINTLDLDRLLSPTNFTVAVTNDVETSYSWSKMAGTTEYVLEVYKGAIAQANLYETYTITPNEIPYQVTLPGGFSYNARVKAKGEKDESKWTVTTFSTKVEQLFILTGGKVPPADITPTSVTLRWRAGATVTALNFYLEGQSTPAFAAYTLSPTEIASGEATVAGLTPETAYTVNIVNQAVVRGTVNFTSGMENPITLSVTRHATSADFAWVSETGLSSLKVFAGTATTGTALKTSNLTAGQSATIVTGLTPETVYTAALYNGTRVRGQVTFTTYKDVSGGTHVNNTADLLSAIATVAAGTQIVLDANTDPEGYYNIGAAFSLSKSISLIGNPEAGTTKVVGAVTLAVGVVNFSVEDILFDGMHTSSTPVNTFITIGVTLANPAITVKNCEVTGYGRTFLYAASGVQITSGTLTIDGAYVHDLTATGGDGIDIRASVFNAITIRNSTFDNCFRSMLRYDNVASSSTASAVTITNNTLNNVSPTVDRTNNKGLLYARYANATFSVTKNIISNPSSATNASTMGSNPLAAGKYTFQNNYAWNCPSTFWKAAPYDQATVITADGGSVLTADPYTDAAAGNFKLTNTALVEAKIGDPRWW